MENDNGSAVRGKFFWLGWVLSILPCLLLIMSASMKFMPFTGSPPMPTHVLWPMPRSLVCHTASYVSVPLRLTMPTALRVEASSRCV